MVTLVIVMAVILVAGAIATAVNRRRPDVPTTPQLAAPQQLDRNDFDHPDRPWLLALFSSETCLSCADARSLIRPLSLEALAVEDVALEAKRPVHQRYGIEAVPILVLADHEGVVRWSFMGPPPAAAVSNALVDAGIIPPEDGIAVALS